MSDITEDKVVTVVLAVIMVIGGAGWLILAISVGARFVARFL